ncbi:hypothetical protein D3C73_1488620 [compost metagenome]
MSKIRKLTISLARFVRELKFSAALATSGKRLMEISDPMSKVFSALAVQSLRIRDAWLAFFCANRLRREVTALLCCSRVAQEGLLLFAS